MKRFIIVAIVVMLILLFFPLPEVRAAGQIRFTTTAHFDSGNKSDPGNEFISQDGIDQPYYSALTRPNAQYIASLDRTYLAFLGGNGYLPMVTYYDHLARRYATPIAATSSNPNVGDGHSAPSMFITPDGIIHVFCCAHFSNIHHRRSTNPYDHTSWTGMPNVTTGGTYPSEFYYSNRLYIVYRQGPSQGPGLTSWDWRFTTDGGSTWTAATKFIDLTDRGNLTTSGLYTNGFTLSGSKLWYSFQWLDPDAAGPTSLRRNVYVAYWDLTTNTQHNVTGFDMGTTVNWTEAEAHAKSLNESHIWTASTHLFNGNPYTIYNSGRADYYSSGLYEGKVNFTRWTGSAWTAPETITTTDEQSNYIDSIPDATGIEAFITTDGIISNDVNDIAWRYSGDLERYTWTPSGGWDFQGEIMRESHANGPANFPTIPLDFRPDLRLSFAEFGRDVAKSEQKIYAWGSNGLVYDHFSTSSTFGVDTSTTNANTPSGAFELANARSDTFATSHATADNWKFNYYETGTSPIPCTSLISGGKVRLNWSGSGASGCNLMASWITDAGDWTIIVRFTDVTATGPMSFVVYAMNQADKLVWGPCCPEGLQNSTNGVAYGFSPVLDSFKTYKIIAGVLTQQTDSSPISCTPTCYMRVIHTQSTAGYAFAHSTDGSSYTTDHSFVFSNQAEWKFLISAGGAGSPLAWTANIDQFDLTVGTVADGYRTSGTWETPNQVWNNEVPSSILINTTGGSSSRYIDSVAILNPEGEVIYEDTSNRFAASNEVEIPGTDQLGIFGRNWTVTIDLASDGTGSIAVTEVFIVTTRSTLSIALFDAPWILGFLALLTLGVIGAIAIRRKRRGQ